MTNHKITIKNLGPIKEINNFEIKKINFLTGKSGTGKSLICKAIYCFNGFFDNLIFVKSKNAIEEFIKSLIEEFFEDYNNFKIIYYYDDENFITIIKNPKIKISFSQDLKITTDNIYQEYLKNRDENNILLLLHKLFYQDLNNSLKSTYFIPASRNFALDFNMVINDLLDIGSRSIDGSSFSYEMRKFASHFQKFIRKSVKLHSNFNDIIRGKFDIANGIISFLPDGATTPISVSSISTGQKEILSIAVILSKLLEKKEECLLIIEEPESNLFPEDQLKLLEFLVFFANETNSKLLITSHSPYFCGLADAILVEDKKDNKLIDPKEFSANYIDNGKLISIFDKEDKEVNIDYIDSASDLISDKYRVNKGDE